MTLFDTQGLDTDTIFYILPSPCSVSRLVLLEINRLGQYDYCDLNLLSFLLMKSLSFFVYSWGFVGRSDDEGHSSETGTEHGKKR